MKAYVFQVKEQSLVEWQDLYENSLAKELF
jgi:hypothetical protein